MLQYVLTQMSEIFPFLYKRQDNFSFQSLFSFPTALFFTGNVITYLSNAQHGILTLILNVIEMFKPVYFSLSHTPF